MNEKNKGQICSRCHRFMEKFKRNENPVCQVCQKDACRMRTMKRDSLIREINSWKSWVCDCYYGEGFIIPRDHYCCFTCLAINPRFHEDHKEKPHSS